jgi:hypothetical protein
MKCRAVRHAHVAILSSARSAAMKCVILVVQQGDGLRHCLAGRFDHLTETRPMFDLLRGGARQAVAGALGGDKEVI